MREMFAVGLVFEIRLQVFQPQVTFAAAMQIFDFRERMWARSGREQGDMEFFVALNVKIRIALARRRQ